MFSQTRILMGELEFSPNTLRAMRGIGIDWVNDGDGLGLSTNSYMRPSTLSAIRSLGYNYLRVPGGYLARWFHWRKSIGTVRGSSRNYLGRLETVKAGIGEMKRFAATFDMETMYTLNVSDSPDDVSELLKTWENLEPQGRAEIQFVEMGNEEYDRDPTEKGVRWYLDRVIPLIASVRQYDSSIRIGAVVSNPQALYWDATVFRALKTKVDYLIWHRYVPYSRYEDSDSYEKTVQGFAQVDNELGRLRTMMGDDPLPILITEYNLSFYDGKNHQNVSLAPRYYLTQANFLMLAVKHRVQGMAKWTLSNPKWHMFADLNFNGKAIPDISIGGIVSRVLNTWIVHQDSIAVWTASSVESYQFSIMVGKYAKNQLSLLIQNHADVPRTVEWDGLASARVVSSVSLLESEDGRQLWTDTQGKGLASGKNIFVRPFSLTVIDFESLNR